MSDSPLPACQIWHAWLLSGAVGVITVRGQHCNCCHDPECPRPHVTCERGMRGKLSLWTLYQPNNPASPLGTLDAPKSGQEE